ncbi:hypothetical protein F4818DRAFT_125222 [Hypoxylon cercidicola]|nr:hypothetical protein F4818DRAFT_125222 [Hypoxylon cercidicola]
MARNSKDVPSSSICGRPPDFPSGLPRGKLWSPENAGAPPSPKASNQSRGNLIAQPETRPISSEQLIAEVKGIYAGLVMVESKCIEVDNSQTENDAALNNEQWQALIALHRTLLLENHDFFLASQHPSASQALRRLASKYAMPARLWRHGVTVPAFEDTWMGDLGRYRLVT